MPTTFQLCGTTCFVSINTYILFGCSRLLSGYEPYLFDLIVYQSITILLNLVQKSCKISWALFSSFFHFWMIFLSPRHLSLVGLLVTDSWVNSRFFCFQRRCIFPFILWSRLLTRRLHPVSVWQGKYHFWHVLAACCCEWTCCESNCCFSAIDARRQSPCEPQQWQRR